MYARKPSPSIENWNSLSILLGHLENARTGFAGGFENKQTLKGFRASNICIQHVHAYMHSLWIHFRYHFNLYLFNLEVAKPNRRVGTGTGTGRFRFEIQFHGYNGPVSAVNREYVAVAGTFLGLQA